MHLPGCPKCSQHSLSISQLPKSKDKKGFFANSRDCQLSSSWTGTVRLGAVTGGTLDCESSGPVSSPSRESLQCVLARFFTLTVLSPPRRINGVTLGVALRYTSIIPSRGGGRRNTRRILGSLCYSMTSCLPGDNQQATQKPIESKGKRTETQIERAILRFLNKTTQNQTSRRNLPTLSTKFRS